MDNVKLIGYFKSHVGKCLLLDNGNKVCLQRVIVDGYTMFLKFSFDNKYTELQLDRLDKEYKIMYIPEGLYFTTRVEIGTIISIGSMIEHVLENWTSNQEEENEELKLGLTWLG